MAYKQIEQEVYRLQCLNPECDNSRLTFGESKDEEGTVVGPGYQRVEYFPCLGCGEATFRITAISTDPEVGMLVWWGSGVSLEIEDIHR